MSTRSLALIWAVNIIVAAVVANRLGLNDGASLGLILGLTGAAIGSIYSVRGARCAPGKAC